MVKAQKDVPWVTVLSEVLLCLLALAITCSTVGDYGLGWDELSSSKYGELVYEYFRTGGKDKSCNRFFDMRFYGPIVDCTAAAFYQNGIGSKFLVRHFSSAILALMTIPAVIGISRGYKIGLLSVTSGVVLLLLPRFYGHAFINTKDIPFACLFSWTMFLLLKLVTADSLQMSWRRFFLLAVAIGLTTSIRPGGWLLLGLIVPTYLLALWWTVPNWAGNLNRKHLLGKVLCTFFLAWTMMVIPWPWAHESPILNPLLAIKTASAFHFEFPVLFEGRIVMSGEMPAIYLGKMLMITTPIPVVIFAGLGIFDTLRKISQRESTDQSAAAWIMLLWVIVPVLIWSLMRPNIYDGIRHFLFVLPALALLATAGIHFLRNLYRASRFVMAGDVVLLLLVLSPIWSIVELHPYQMTYYNGIVGGLRGAEGNYETDYWVTSFRELAEWLNDRQSEQSERPLKVLIVANRWNRLCIENYLDPRIELTLVDRYEEEGKIPEHERYRQFPGQFPDEFDFFATSYRVNRGLYYPDSPIVHTVGRDDAVFALIRGHTASEPRK